MANLKNWIYGAWIAGLAFWPLASITFGGWWLKSRTEDML
jgi:hypothetical protein